MPVPCLSPLALGFLCILIELFLYAQLFSVLFQSYLEDFMKILPHNRYYSQGNIKSGLSVYMCATGKVLDGVGSSSDTDTAVAHIDALLGKYC